MGYEIVILILSVVALCVFQLGQFVWGNWRDLHRGEVLDKLLAKLKGASSEEAVRLFGDPTEIAEGTTGPGLHIWREAVLPHVPKGRGLVVITLQVEADGRISGTHWQQRGRE